MMKRCAVVVAFALLATMPALAYAATSYPSGLAILAAAGLLSALLGWQLLRRIDALRAGLEAERQHTAKAEAATRQVLGDLERKLEERAAELIRQRDIAVRTEKLTALSRLAGGVAHELNNPLMAILGEAMILRERCNVPELSRGLRVIEQQAARCAGLIRDLTAFASQEQQKVQALDVHALLEGALSQAGMVAPSQEVKVLRQYSQEPLIVTGNMEQLQQALINVIGNAYQAMAANGGGRLTLRTARTEDNRVRLELSDTGVGIEAEMLPYVFDPFFSRPLGKGGAGVGMGLSVALGLVQAHEGRIWVESAVGKGTTVHIDLPASEPQAELQPEQATTSPM